MTSYVSLSSSLVQQWMHIYVSLADFYDLVSGSHLFGIRRWSTGSWTFLGDDFWMFSVSSSCRFNTGHMLLQFTEAFWVSTAENCGFSAVAAHFQGRRLPCRTAEAHPHDQAVQQTIVIPFLPHTRWSMSLCTGRADFLRGAEADFHGPDCSSDHSCSPVVV